MTESKSEAWAIAARLTVERGPQNMVKSLQADLEHTHTPLPSDDEVEKLLEAAQAATPGPWTIKSNTNAIVSRHKMGIICRVSLGYLTTEAFRANQRFITAADPAAIIGLCDLIRSLRTSLATARGEGQPYAWLHTFRVSDDPPDMLPQRFLSFDDKSPWPEKQRGQSFDPDAIIESIPLFLHRTTKATDNG